MFAQLRAVGVDADVLFLDDNSPDGTGHILDGLAREVPSLRVIHRDGKLGIGSAHLDGINWAYDRGYKRLVTLDCDFTHSPADIPRLLEHTADAALVVGSRYLEKDSLRGWNPFRMVLTRFGHTVTSQLLKLPQDATGAFRVYDLTRIPRTVFSRIASRGYAFFVESLFLIVRNGHVVREVPIALPARTYGHSKMSLREVARSAGRILELCVTEKLSPERLRVGEPFTDVNASLVDPQHWDAYWEPKTGASAAVYDFIAKLYRDTVIKPRLNRTVRQHFPAGSRLLHAGCGSGQVDTDLQQEMEITAVDISVAALNAYRRNNPRVRLIRHASVFELPFPDESFDGAYNLGVVEHFAEPEIRKLLSEVRRVLRAGGTMVIFWPHARASSVLVLKAVHWVLNDILRRKVQLHPPEVSLFRSLGVVEPMLRESGFEVVDCAFGARDFFVQAVLVLRKQNGVVPGANTAS